MDHRKLGAYLAHMLLIVFGMTALITGVVGMLTGPWIALITAGGTILFFVVLIRVLFPRYW